VFGPGSRFPYAKDAAYVPPDSPFEAVQHLHGILGMERAGDRARELPRRHMRVTLDAIARSNGRYRGTRSIDETYGEREFQPCTTAAFRGCASTSVKHLGGRPDMASSSAPSIASRRWAGT